MTLHSVVLFVHVLAAIVLVGHSLFSPVVHAAIRSASTRAALLGWLRVARDSARLNPIAALVLLASGLQLAAGRWAEGWLHVACVLFAVNSTLAVAVVKRTGERLARLAVAAGDVPLTAEVDALRRSARWSLASDVLLANDVAALFIMTVQPGLLASIAATAGANAALLAFRALRRRDPAPVARGLRTAA